MALPLLLSASTLSAAPQERELGSLLARSKAFEVRQVELLEALEPRREEVRERFETYRELYEEGLVARVRFEAVQAELAELNQQWEQEFQKLQQSRQLQLELVARTDPPEEADEALVERSAGSADWALEDLPALSLFFENRFGEALPISARGQTAVHTELGFDHRAGADLAVHPDSEAGQAILVYLREQKIPYVAFRAAVGGSATGAHIHVGRLSPRLSVQ